MKKDEPLTEEEQRRQQEENEWKLEQATKFKSERINFEKWKQLKSEKSMK